ncbi:MAG: cyclohydrolase FolE, partial [Actinomycetota bacterium]
MSTDKTIDAEITYTAERNVDHARAERAVRELLEAIGEDPSRDGLLETPGRVARMWAEVLSGT